MSCHNGTLSKEHDERNTFLRIVPTCRSAAAVAAAGPCVRACCLVGGMRRRLRHRQDVGPPPPPAVRRRGRARRGDRTESALGRRHGPHTDSRRQRMASRDGRRQSVTELRGEHGGERCRRACARRRGRSCGPPKGGGGWNAFPHPIPCLAPCSSLSALALRTHAPALTCSSLFVSLFAASFFAFSAFFALVPCSSCR